MNSSAKFGTFNVVENKENNGISIYNGDYKVTRHSQRYKDDTELGD